MLQQQAMDKVCTRRLAATDVSSLTAFFRQRWGDDRMVVHDTEYCAATLPGFVAVKPTGEWVGVLTYVECETDVEIVSLDAVEEGQGIGTALCQTLLNAFPDARVWLVTTNDNLGALRFWQKRGFSLVSVDVGAVERARRLKPSIPLMGYDGIPIRHELRLEYSRDL